MVVSTAFRAGRRRNLTQTVAIVVQTAAIVRTELICDAVSKAREIFTRFVHLRKRAVEKIVVVVVADRA